MVFLSALFYLPAVAWVALMVVMVLYGLFEWARLAKFSSNGVIIYLLLSVLPMLGIAWVNIEYAAHIGFTHLLVYGLSALLWVTIVPAWMIGSWQVRQPLLMALLGWILLIPTGLAMIDLRQQDAWLLLGIMGLVWVADIAAYFTGRKFGKHKLAPGISPSKTWEGVGGALLGVTLYVLLVAWMSGFFELQTTLLGMVLLSAWLGVGFSVIGDLFESAIKRQAGVKDSGTILPGHGGLLDRIDALTSTLPIAAGALLLQKIL